MEQHGSSRAGEVLVRGRRIPFLGYPITTTSGEHTWEQGLLSHELVFLRNHRVGFVALLPGTCYIEIARALVRIVHGDSAFELVNVQFSTIMFLDDDLDGTPTIRATLSPSGVLTLTSRREQSSWDSHSTMALQMASEKREYLDVSASQERCTEHVTHSQFYAQCGNDYQGEFKAMADAWGRNGGSEVLSRVEYGHTETQHPHLRSCAWLDACQHAPYYWSDNRARPFYMASVKSYHIRAVDFAQNKAMWSLMLDSRQNQSDDLQPDVLKYHSADRRVRVQIDGSRLGFFEIGWLEARRVQRHMYEVSWGTASSSVAHPAKVPVLLLDTACSTMQSKEQDLTASAVAKQKGPCVVYRAALRDSVDQLEPLNALTSVLSLLQTVQAPVALRFVTFWVQPAMLQRRVPVHGGLFGLTRVARQVRSP